MKAEDFRLGNYYHFKQTGNKYSELNGWVVSEMGINVLEALHHESGDGWCKPIPLTEEWLLKLGFEKITDDDFNCMEMRVFKNFLFYADSQDLFSSVSLMYLDEPADYDSNGVFTTIHHVHQLQNIYYDLTGEEIKIKDNQ